MQSHARQLRDEDRPQPRPPRRLHAVPPEEGPGDVPVEIGDAPVYAENGRRTVTITGQPVPPRRRRSPAVTQLQARPDRIALWAVLLGLFLVFMAVATAHAASL